MPHLPPVTSKEFIKILEKKGFILNRTKGSHHFFVHPRSKKIAVVPMHNKDLPIGTLLAILKQAGIDKNEL